MGFIYDLAWADVDPARVPFSPDGQRAAIAQDIEALLAASPEWRKAFIERVTAGLVQRHGPWAQGWSFSVGEGSCGGVVQAWCCPSHSLPKGAPTPEKVLALAGKVEDALGQWRRHLEALAADFREAPPSEGDPTLALLELDEAVGRVLDHVVRATGCEDAWYAYAETAVGWLLEARGAPRERAQAVAGDVLGGRFESWISPAEDLLRRCRGEAATRAMDLLAR